MRAMVLHNTGGSWSCQSACCSAGSGVVATSRAAAHSDSQALARMLRKASRPASVTVNVSGPSDATQSGCPSRLKGTERAASNTKGSASAVRPTSLRSGTAERATAIASSIARPSNPPQRPCGISVATRTVASVASSLSRESS